MDDWILVSMSKSHQKRNFDYRNPQVYNLIPDQFFIKAESQ